MKLEQVHFNLKLILIIIQMIHDKTDTTIEYTKIIHLKVSIIIFILNLTIFQESGVRFHKRLNVAVTRAYFIIAEISLLYNTRTLIIY